MVWGFKKEFANVDGNLLNKLECDENRINVPLIINKIIPQEPYLSITQKALARKLVYTKSSPDTAVVDTPDKGY